MDSAATLAVSVHVGRLHVEQTNQTESGCAGHAECNDVDERGGAGKHARDRKGDRQVRQRYGQEQGNCTWGAGILAHHGVCSSDELGRLVNAQSVDIVFARKVAEAEGIVRRRISISLNQAQFDALCSLVYNAGSRGVSDTFNFINNSDFAGAAANMSRMIKVTILEKGKKKTVVAPGLIKRRAEESAPFRISPSKQPAAEQAR